MGQGAGGSAGDDRTSGGPVRDRMVGGATVLLATKGIEGTTFAKVLEATDSPRGSVYHHFPGGKPELIHAALDLASSRGLAAMEATRGRPASLVVQRFLELWRSLLDRSHLTAGCAVLAVTVATDDDELLDHAGSIFRSWTELLTQLCVAGGVPLDSATEGAVALCRAERSRQPFDDIEAVLLSLVPGV
jgi:TetR/AcrR family transcriptional repressor of lmrAB and yxaGH operons